MTKEEIRAKLAERLKAEREENGVSKYKIYTEGSLTKGTVDAIERGESVTLDNLLEYCRVAGIDLFGETNSVQI